MTDASHGATVLPRNSRKPSEFRTDIEGLRGIAVLIVVLFHCGFPGFLGGFIGVDVFFVISGYLITGLLAKEVQATSRINLLQFYARRMRRLLPASALTLLLTLGIAGVILAPDELTFAGRAARATALYMSNVFFGINKADYFAREVETNPLLHTWSLAVEEQFYFFWPLLIIFGLQVLRSRKALWALLFGVTIVSLAISVWSTTNGGTFAFYQLPARAWEFSIGGLAALTVCSNSKMRSGGWLALGWIGVAIIIFSAHSISSRSNFPGWIALIPAIGTVAVLLAGSSVHERGVGRFLSSAPLQLLGTLSYSWYLWHWPFLVLAQALYWNITLVGKVGVAIISLIFAAITHRIVENPIRFSPYLMEKPMRSIYCGAAITIVSLTVAASSIEFAGRISNTTEMKLVTASIEDIARLPREQCITLGESSEIKECVFGEPSSEKSIFLFGDSHAMQWFNPIQRIAEAHHWKLISLTKSGCPATDIRDMGLSPRFAAACNEWRAESIRRIVNMRPNAVFVGNSTTYLKGDNVKSRVSLVDWRDGTRRTLETLSTAGLRVVAIRDIPIFPYDVPTCVARSIRRSSYSRDSCDMSEAVGIDPLIFQAEKAAAEGLANIHFIDMTDQFCQLGTCRAVREGEIMYRDDDHITGSFADRLMPVFEARSTIILNSVR